MSGTNKTHTILIKVFERGTFDILQLQFFLIFFSPFTSIVIALAINIFTFTLL